MRIYKLLLLLNIAFLIAVGIWGYNQYKEPKELEILLNNKYKLAFLSTNEHIQNLEAVLQLKFYT